MISGIYSLSALQQAIAFAPKQWRPLVFTNGCFDLLHVGHVRYLKVAQSLGRSRIMGLNSDHSVKTLKPNIYIKGGDYSLATLPEALAVQAYGGQIELVKVEIPFH